MLSLFPSLKKVKAFEQKLQIINLQRTANGSYASVNKWIELMFAIPDFVNELDLKDKKLLFKIGGDGFRLSRGRDQVNMYFTLFNLGQLIHSPAYVFTLLALEGRETRELFGVNLSLFLEEFRQLKEKGTTVKIK